MGRRRKERIPSTLGPCPTDSHAAIQTWLRKRNEEIDAWLDRRLRIITRSYIIFMAALLIGLILILAFARVEPAHASVPPPNGKPHWPAYRVAGARNASALATGATSWVKWSYRKAIGYRLVNVGGSCVRTSGIETWTCSVRSTAISPHGTSRYTVNDWFIGCDARSTVRHHAWKLNEAAWIDRPTILVHRPAKGQPWNPTRDGGVVCSGHQLRGNNKDVTIAKRMRLGS